MGTAHPALRLKIMLLIMCPTSKSGRGKRHWPYWKDCLAEAGVPHRCIETEYRGHAFEIARDADDTVVAVGGDGIINEVINGAMAASKQKNVGVLYSGTSPDFCRFHGISVAPSESIRTLLSSKPIRVDVVKVQYNLDDDSPIEKYFASSSNIGLGSDVARFSNARRKIFGDTAGTFLGLMRAITLHKPQDLELIIDGQKHLLEKCNHLMVIKNPYIASGLKLDLDIKNNDGRGYVMGICKKSKIGLLKLLPDIYSGKIAGSKDVFLKPFTRVEVSCEEKVELEFDGDPQGYLPLKAEILTRHLDLIGAVHA